MLQKCRSAAEVWRGVVKVLTVLCRYIVMWAAVLVWRLLCRCGGQCGGKGVLCSFHWNCGRWITGILALAL